MYIDFESGSGTARSLKTPGISPLVTGVFRFTAGMTTSKFCPFLQGSPRHVLFWVGLGRDSIFTGFHGIFQAGLNTHGTSQDGTHLSRDFALCFSWDAISTRHHGTALINCGIPRNVLPGILEPRDATLEYFCIPCRYVVCEVCTGFAVQEPIADQRAHDKTKTYTVMAATMLHLTSCFALNNATQSNQNRDLR